MRVLIAEDSWVLADTLSVLMEEQGARVVGPTATNTEALKLLAAHEVDAAIVDMELGDSFADTLAEGLVERKVPYVIVTGFGALPSNADENAAAVMRKPVDRRALVEILSSFAAVRE